MLTFDDATLKRIDVSYRGADITRRRMANMAALAPRPGDRLLDLGCGQGLMTEELARAVGDGGAVIGVDPSPAMRAQAQARCAGYDQIAILDGAAGALPLDDGTLDGAISLQVFEYVDDLAGALSDLQRKLKPGGRLVIGDMHWDTFAWASDEPARMAAMMRAWEGHVAQPHVPARLPELLHGHGFQLLELKPLPFSAIVLRPDSLPYMMLHVMRAYALDNGLLPPAEIEAWFGEQFERAAQGRFFFSLTHFIAIAYRR